MLRRYDYISAQYQYNAYHSMAAAATVWPATPAHCPVPPRQQWPQESWEKSTPVIPPSKWPDENHVVEKERKEWKDRDRDKKKNNWNNRKKEKEWEKGEEEQKTLDLDTRFVQLPTFSPDLLATFCL